MAVKKVNNINKIIKNLQKSTEESLNEIGIKGVANIQSNTPVDTGTLKRSWNFKTANKNKSYKITFGTSIEYAIYIEFKPNKSQGFFRETLISFKDEATGIIAKSISRL